MRKVWIVGVLTILIVSGCSEMKPQRVDVDLFDPDGNKLGTAEISENNEGVKIKVTATGLKPGAHGFHIHENGECKGPDFKSAGGHFNPEDNDHGLLNPDGPHLGDLKNLVVKEDGKVDAEVTAENVTLEEGDPRSLLKAGGTSLVIHEGPDDGMSDPAGNAGKRVACGEIAVEE